MTLDELHAQLLTALMDPVKTTVSDGQVTTMQDIDRIVAALKYLDARKDELADREAAANPEMYAPIRLIPGFN